MVLSLGMVATVEEYKKDIAQIAPPECCSFRARSSGPSERAPGSSICPLRTPAGEGTSPDRGEHERRDDGVADAGAPEPRARSVQPVIVGRARQTVVA